MLEERRLKKLSSPMFRKIDADWKRHYHRINPYKVCRTFWNNPHGIYGETPLSALDPILKECALGPSDVFYDLGAGRARLAIYVAATYPCKVRAVEKIELFNHHTMQLIATYPLHLELHDADILEIDVSDATLIYFYGITFSDNFIRKVAEKIPYGCRVITVSEPLGGRFSVLKKYWVRYPWGKTEVFLQK